MDTIRGIVRNIAIVILLASFLEMLLPNGSMRRFVQLIMGLFVMMAILGPVANMLHKPLALEIPAWSSGDTSQKQEELAAVISQGNKLQTEGQKTALEEYKKAIEQQAKALALTVKGVEKVSLEASTKTTGEIEELRVFVGSQETSIKPVEPVMGQAGTTQSPTLTPEQQRISRELKARLGALLGIKEEQVKPEFQTK